MLEQNKQKPILVLDFDGVCHSYTSGWKGAAVIPDPPVEGLFEFLYAASGAFDVQIFSSRSNQEGGIKAMNEWFIKHAPEWYFTSGVWPKFPSEKPPAFIGIDDRVLTFRGVWPSIDELKNFKTWNAKDV